MFGLNPMEIIIVGAVAVLLFGSRASQCRPLAGQEHD